VKQEDNQDKQLHCQVGLCSEKKFLNSVAKLYGLSLEEHPQKKANKYATDMRTKNGYDVDLKHVETPFFTAGNYNMDPSHAVTLNHNDYIRYMYKYPNEWTDGMYIIFWVQWKAQAKYGQHVEAINGVWIINIHTIDCWIRSGVLPCHEYKERRANAGTNAKYSWIIDLRNCVQRKPLTKA
jgi:hypothetical protein